MFVIQTRPFSVICMGITQSKSVHYTVGAQSGCSLGTVLLFFSFRATATMQSTHYGLPRCFAASPGVKEILPRVSDPRSCSIFLDLRAWGCLFNDQGDWNFRVTGLWAETFTHIVFGLLCLPGPMNKARNCEM